MIKKLFLLTLAIGVLVSCNNPSQEEGTQITTTDFSKVAEGLVDKTVSIEGTVLHVCQHGGKKMFLNEDRVKVIASEKVASFSTELQGSDVVIKGIIREEAAPVLSEDDPMTNHDKPVTQPAEGEEAAEDCEMEAVKPLYVVEVISVTEKVQ